MRKQLLSLALAAVAFMPAFNANAEDAKLVEKWNIFTTDLNADWDATTPDWSSDDAIKSKSCARMGHGRNGKIYSVNMKTMSIIQFDETGWKDMYKLPKLEGDDYYGSAISMDEAGNFLIGHYFTKSPESSTHYTIYQPSTGKYQHFELDVPDDYSCKLDNVVYTGIGRSDCVGRVLGDMTDNAVFFIAPDAGAAGVNARMTRVVYLTGNGEMDGKIDIDGTETSPAHYLGAGQQNIAQPFCTTYDEFYELDHGYEGFILFSSDGSKWAQIIKFNSEGKVDYSWINAFKMQAGADAGNKACAMGFDSFVIDGERYMAVLYTTSDNKRGMDVAIINSKGAIVAKWVNTKYYSTDGFVSITAEPLEDGTANIYVYGSNTYLNPNTNIKGGVGAAMLNFTPEVIDETLGEISNPYKITKPADLVNMGGYLKEGDFYVTLENDIDMAGVNYPNVPMNENSKTVFHFNGKNHVIKNLTINNGNASVFGTIVNGSVENLGVENITAKMDWYCVGGIAGVANNAIISNCYVTGNLTGAATAGIVGANNGGNLVISDCYSIADINSVNGHGAGIISRIEGNVTISNAYAAGSVYAKTYAAGIANIRETSATATVALNNVIAWESSVESAAETQADAVATTPVADLVTMSNVLVWNELEVNGEKIDGGVAEDKLMETAQGWEAYASTLVDGMPALKWQTGEAGGFNDVVVDEAASDAPAVYYNLQGVRVDNPRNGIFVRVAGGKATKVVK